MTFPSTPRDVLVEMMTGSSWTNITGDVYTRDPIEIGRGKSDEAGTAAPSYCKFTLNNADGKYSPRNPISPYYGLIGRNTQVRVAFQVDPVYDAFSSTFGTGDLSWTHTPVGDPTGVVVYVWQYNTSAGQIASVTYGGVPMERKIFGLFVLGGVNAVGYMYFLNRDIPAGPQTVVVDTTAVITRYASAITVTGGTTAEIDLMTTAYSNATPTSNPFTTAATSKRAIIFGTLLSELDDGSTIAPQGGYTQLGETDIGTETVSVDRTTLVLAPATYSIGWTTGTSAHWGIMGVAIRTVQYRFWGETSSLPPKWDSTGKDAWVPLDAAGQLRRLNQGTTPAETGLRSFIYSQTGLFRYWPLDAAKGTQYTLDIAPVWGTPTNMRFYCEAGTGSFQYGQDLGSAYLSTGMAFFNSTVAPMRGDVAMGYANWAFDFVFQTPAPMGDFTLNMLDYNGATWGLTFSSGVAQVSFDDGITGPIGFSPTGSLAALLDTDPHHVRLKLLKNVGATDWTLYIDGNVVDSGTQPSYNVYGISVFRMYMTRAAGQQYINLAHIAIWGDATSETWPSAAAVSQAAQGYDGEAAGTRMQRICSLAGITLAVVGDPADTAIMGPQYSESTLTQLRDAEQTDMGVLTEPRDRLGLLYRTRTSQYNQTPSLTLSHADGHLMLADFQPVDDDQFTRNDITVVRREGGNFRLSKDVGPLSTLEPPAGVGRYRDEVTVNVQNDALLQPVASWLLNRGTLDEARYPSIPVNLANHSVATDGLDAAVLATDVGDWIKTTNAAGANIYDDILLSALGYTEQILLLEHVIRFVCGPATPYKVAVWGSGVGTGPDRYDTAGSSLTGGVTSTATSLSVTTVAGNVPWTTTAAEFPFDIVVAGERMTVTNITSATSPQTFTVTRSVNGVIKAQAAGASVRLWSTPRYAL